MTRFHFRLESLRNLRELQLHAEENALAALFGQKAGLQSTAVHLQQQCRALAQDSRNHKSVGVLASQLQFVEIECMALRHAAAEVNSKIEHLNLAIARQQETYIEARRESEKLENVYAADLRSWHRERKRRDQAAVDGLFLMRLRMRTDGNFS